MKKRGSTPTYYCILGMVLPEPIGLDTPRWLDHSLRSSAYCWCDNFTMSAQANGFMHRFYIIELQINQWDENDPRNSELVYDEVCDKRPIYENEFRKIYIRRNGYIRELYGKNVTKLKNDTYLKKMSIPKLEMNTDDDDTEYFSYDSSD